MVMRMCQRHCHTCATQHSDPLHLDLRNKRDDRGTSLTILQLPRTHARILCMAWGNELADGWRTPCAPAETMVYLSMVPVAAKVCMLLRHKVTCASASYHSDYIVERLSH
jgi:hypothetical protein